MRAAEGYAIERVNNAPGRRRRASCSIYDEYRKAPEVTRRRLYLETLNEVLPKAGRKIIIDERKGHRCRCCRSRRGELPGGEAVKPHAFSAVVACARVLVVVAVVGALHGERDRAGRSSPSSASRRPAASPSPGLHFKVPFVQTRQPFRQALARMGRRPEPDPDEGQEVHLGGHATRAGASSIRCASSSACATSASAQSRLDDIIDGETRNVIANHDLIEVVRTTNRDVPRTEENADVDIEGGRGCRARSTMGRDKITRAHPRKSRRASSRSSASSWWTCRSSASTTSTRCSRRSSSG